MAIPTLGAMIAAMGSPAEWGAVSVNNLSWDDTNKILQIRKDVDGGRGAELRLYNDTYANSAGAYSVLRFQHRSDANRYSEIRGYAQGSFGLPLGVFIDVTNSSDVLIQVAGFFADGTVTNYGNSEHWNTTSDERLKKNISNFTLGLQELIQLQPKAFEYNGKLDTIDGKKGFGLIAQDVESVLPEAVTKRVTKLDDKETEVLGLNIGDHIHYMVINAIKELADRVDKLEKK